MELDSEALDTAEERGQYLLAKELLTFIEEYDDEVERGVLVDRLEAYADALDERGVQSVDAEQMDELLEADRTDAETWVDSDAIYDVGDGFSAFPARWHDELRGEADVLRYVDVIDDDLAGGEKETATGATGDGVPQDLLLDAVSALGPYSRDGAKSEIERLREEGYVEELADQHPHARIVPTHE
ncbi:hypothetical protein OB920_11455 [Halobacteria archaeon HArc-gm2]|nr:hypothetical protein [Halobacteria archaeon HArc-gm2]